MYNWKYSGRCLGGVFGGTWRRQFSSKEEDSEVISLEKSGAETWDLRSLEDSKELLEMPGRSLESWKCDLLFKEQKHLRYLI